MDLINKIHSERAKIGVIGLGYVGLPLVIEFLKAGFEVTGFDIDNNKVEMLLCGKMYIRHIDIDIIVQKKSSFLPTSDFSKLSEMDCIIICVPTPLNKYREPNMSYVFDTTATIASHLRKGQLIVLESTTYPGTTDEDMLKILEKEGLRGGVDFYLAFSPEREDPNNKDFNTRTIPKVVGGLTPQCLRTADTLYSKVVERTVPVSSTKIAEATKLLENIYRSVNIALINELKILFHKMDIDIWEVIEAASTKPFGFQPFYPGPGLGGHCIPIDPFYLTWKAREYDFSTRFIELAGEVNTGMPYYVVERAGWIMNMKSKSVKGSRIIVLGMAYKKDIDDQRESPSLKIIQLLRNLGALVSYNDPFVPCCREHRHYPDIDMTSTCLSEETLKSADLVIVSTDHTDYDYFFIEKHASLILDTRGVFRRLGIKSTKVVTA